MNMSFLDFVRLMPHLELQMMALGSSSTQVSSQMMEDVMAGLNFVRMYDGVDDMAEGDEEKDAKSDQNVPKEKDESTKEGEPKKEESKEQENNEGGGDASGYGTRGTDVGVSAQTQQEQKWYVRLDPTMRRGAEGQRPRKLTFNVTDRDDLWRIFHRAPGATMVIPECDDFEWGGHSSRQVDSIHSFITSAIQNLTEHVRMNRSNPHFSESAHNGVARTIDELNALLDVEEPFRWIVKCPTGVSSFNVMDGVTVTDICEEAEGLSVRPWERAGGEAVTGRELQEEDEPNTENDNVDAVVWPDP